MQKQKYLPSLNDYTNFQAISPFEYPQLAQEIRAFLIQLAHEREIHFSANLGVVELTIALLHHFNPNLDWILWDTGHQTYVYKILTGRSQLLHQVRSWGGIAGLMEMKDSPYDHYSPGHSGNTLSVLMGLMNKPRRYKVLVIGDSGFVNGTFFEALNDLGAQQLPVVIILNDNGMSISPGVGGFHETTSKMLLGVPSANPLSGFCQTLGIQYLGPFNGHDFASLDDGMREAIRLVQNGPVLLHFQTVKGKGYSPAEQDHTGQYHALKLPPPGTAFTHQNIATKCRFGVVVTKYLQERIQNDPMVRIINPAMSFGTAMLPLQGHPHFHDVGIAEEHAVSLASGLALAGCHVYVAIYSTFLQRTYDQLLHDVSRLSLKMIFLLDRADLSGGDGPSHHGIFDVGMVKSIPNTIIASPRDEKQLMKLLKIADQDPKGHLWFIRYPKVAFLESGIVPSSKEIGPDNLVPLVHKWEWLRTNPKNKICLLTYGPYTDVLFHQLEQLQLQCDLVNACFITGYDDSEINHLFKRNYHTIICYERIWGTTGLYQDLAIKLAQTHKHTRLISLHYEDGTQRGETAKIDSYLQMDASSVMDRIKSELIKIKGEKE